MKSKVLLFGSTGNLGQFVFWELIKQDFDVTIVVRDKVKAVEHFSYWANIVDLEGRSVKELPDEIYKEHEIVISLLGNRIAHAFTTEELVGMDFFEANDYILMSSIRTGIKKFGVVTPFYEKAYLKQNYHRKHEQFQKNILESGINYTIIKSNQLFSVLLGKLKESDKIKNVVIGDGRSKVNPIYDGDVASLLVQNLSSDNILINSGGPEVFSRFEIAEILQLHTNGSYSIVTIKPITIPTILPYLKIRNPMLYERMTYFYHINRNDFICTPLGSMTFQQYLDKQSNESFNKYDRIRLLQKNISFNLS